MAFCTSCGAQIADGAMFCTGCGAAQTQTPQTVASSQTAAAAPVAAATVQPEPKQGGSALKVVLIVLAVVFGLIILGIAAAVGVGVYIAKNSKVHQHGKDATISTPFGEVSTTTDPSKVAEQIGVEVYPGATPWGQGASVGTFGGMSVANAMFESDDSIDQIEQFYTSKYPNSRVNAGGGNNRTMIFDTEQGKVTIVLMQEGSKTKIHISRVNGAK